MSRRLIALNADLLRLRNEGYDLDVRGGAYLLVKDVPYVDSARAVQRGILISKLELAGDRTNKPSDHVAYWTGTHPCHSDGSKIRSIENSSAPQDFADGVRADFTFSAKADYRDYYHKMTTYIGRITGEATKIEPDIDARTFPVVPVDDDGGVFEYADTASTRAGIATVNAKLAGQRIGIIGLGGSGSYVLDLVAKTMVAQIHVFDRDVFSQHNAFRSPGAPTLAQLQARPHKVAHFSAIYSNMHRGIVVHDVHIDAYNVALLDALDFVFLCLDAGPAKRVIVQHLIANRTPFVEVGMGLLLSEGHLTGIVRLTTSTPETRELAAPHISYADDDSAANEYATNIQIAELNALSAALAVIRWKKLFGVYRDATRDFYAGYPKVYARGSCFDEVGWG
jgi:hypothetical protein